MQLGMSESARFTTAEEARFRVEYPNSQPRNSRIIALDDASMDLLRDLADRPWNGAHFLRYRNSKGVSASLEMLPIDAVLEDISGREVSLVEELADADVIVMVMSAGTTSDAAEVIGNAAYVRNKLTTGLVLSSPDVSNEQLARSLSSMRPYAAMMVISNGAEYVSEMLAALRA